MNENDFNIPTMIIIFIVIVGTIMFLKHNAKVNCEKSGGTLVGQMVGKTYISECIKEL